MVFDYITSLLIAQTKGVCYTQKAVMPPVRAFCALFGALLLCADYSWAVQSTPQTRRDTQRFGLHRPNPQRIQEPPAQVRSAFERFNAQQGNRFRIRYHPRTGYPEAILGAKTSPRPGPPDLNARAFLSQHRELFGIDTQSLQLLRQRSRKGLAHLEYAQSHRGLPVEFARVRVHLTERGEILAVDSDYLPEIQISLNPSIAASQALAAVEADLGTPVSAPGELVIFPHPTTGENHLAWKFAFLSRRPIGHWHYYVDAHTGALLFRFNDARFITSGTVSAEVYLKDPPSGASEAPIPNQYVYIQSASTRALTGSDGSYSSPIDGKVFASLKGPFLTVAHHTGQNAEYHDGSGSWTDLALSLTLSSPNPYPNNSNSVLHTLTEPGAQKLRVRFSSFALNFSGADLDFVEILDEKNIVNGIYTDTKLGSFSSIDVASGTLKVKLVSGASGNNTGYTIDQLSKFTLASPATPSPAPTWVWKSTHTFDTIDDQNTKRLYEANAFYHLSRMHDFFKAMDPTLTLIDSPFVAVVHFSQDAAETFYLPLNEAVYLSETGNGNISASLARDVLRHEYTHLVHDQIYPIFNFGQSGAISEAIADYFPASEEGDSQIGEWFITQLSNPPIPAPAPGTCTLTNGAGPRNTDNICSFPANWNGEVHDDSMILSGALWDFRTDFPAFVSISTANQIALDALFFYPDNFQAFLEAMLLADDLPENGGDNDLSSNPPSPRSAQIHAAFSAHGISTATDTTDGVDIYDRVAKNDGIIAATLIENTTSLTATIFPDGDLDYYGFASAKGMIDATLQLPAVPGDPGRFWAYGLGLLDEQRTALAGANPVALPGCDVNGNNCRTNDSLVRLSFFNSAPGQRYLLVHAVEKFNSGSFSNSRTSSQDPYTLTLQFTPVGTLAASIAQAGFDQDRIKFSISVEKFDSGNTFTFDHARLRDQSQTPLAETAPGGSLALVLVSSETLSGQLKGEIQIPAGNSFSVRYPAVGTVFLEIFGKNKLGNVFSLGLSNPFKLTAQQAKLTAWNNVFNPAKGQKATIKYESTEPGRYTLKLYTLNGTLVKTLLDESQFAGKGSVDWNGKNLAGEVVASGVYLLHFQGPGISKTQKVVVVK